MEIFANLIDIPARDTYPARITIREGHISEIRPLQHDTPADILPSVLPGFVDAHVHIESSMLVPSEFARLAVRHGTVATVSDPHEIANVMGVEGVNFMIDDASKVPLKVFFGAPVVFRQPRLNQPVPRSIARKLRSSWLVTTFTTWLK